MSTNRVITVVQTEDDVIQELSNMIQNIANKAIERDDVFKVGLSGGSLTKFLSIGLPKIDTDWSKWRLFFCDERVVPLESADSTYGIYKNSLVGLLPLAEHQFVKIDPHLPAEEAAKDYIQKMAVHFPPDSLPRFHLLLLGMGPDGHTCSLFPGHRICDETSVWVAPITNAPKPPPSRITLTFPVVNNAECCVFAISGAGKAEMVKRILKDDEQLPAGRVKPTDGVLHWLLDSEAGIHIKEK
ncbi:6-phosphogluconolactonase [Blattella germanica]|nr:6-phosphogluconolactonase [Blattella germanica]